MSSFSDLVNINISDINPLILTSKLCKNSVQDDILCVPRQYIHLPTEFKTLGDVKTYLNVAQYWEIADELPYKLYKYVLDHTNYQFTSSKLDAVDFTSILADFQMIPRIKSIESLIKFGIGYKLLAISAELCDITLLKLNIDELGETLGVNYKSIAKKLKKHTETREVVIKKELNFHPAIVTFFKKYITCENFVVDYNIDSYYCSKDITEIDCGAGCPNQTDKKYINNQTGEIYEMCEQCAICHMIYPKYCSTTEH